MSDGNRSGKTGDLGRFGVLAAIALSCLIVGFFAFLEGHQSERDHNSTYEYSQAAKRNASIACRDREPAAIADCIYNEISSATEKSESKQDLNAQKWMARWAGVLVIITMLTTIISWYALRYLRDTFVETRKAVEETSKATKAMRKANKIALESSERQLRAYVVVSAIKFTSIETNGHATGWHIDVIWKNTGATPATFTAALMNMHRRNDGSKMPD